MKFIHCADLHLGSSFEGLSGISKSQLKIIINAGINALTKVVEVAIAENVDFILLAGDVFDGHQINLTLQFKLKNLFEKLQKHDIFVFMAFGNHDFQNLDKVNFYFPENVYIFPNQVITKKIITKNTNEEVAVTGFSYGERWVESKIENYPRHLDVKWHLGMLHGAVLEDDRLQNYAPFRLSELLSKDYDYWALGHIHNRQMLNKKPPIIYAGSLQGRNNKEVGLKGFYMIREIDGQLSPEFRPIDELEWINIDKKPSTGQSYEDIEKELIYDIEHKMNSNNQLTVVSVNLKVEGENTELLKNIQNDYLLRTLRRNITQKAFIRKINYDISTVTESNKLDQEILSQVKNDVFNRKTIDNLLGKLRELEFIDDHFNDEETNKAIFEKAKLNLIEDVESYEDFRS
ncbi:metallophosphoesterase family protein [Liquorilactobacillus hordei]|uniref:DNA repair exonuclease n=1 Tax=Liquorilactobacillus hordei DSM 19519 TaxID=1423759 RepID=A0A0R1MTM8_9LACO|nr:DNA repair exonuclease [Liquorilactobacillus hordei]KRL07795.1 DNA repair exonuclease [Liquorilactobacillus hordei DSM 19519]QYH52050.1 DNA repair exonuclease [Liquorilactobacillus hordei DSM 19519]